MPLNLGIVGHPPNNGSAINGARYRKGSLEVELPGFGIGQTFSIDAEIGDNIELAFRNGAGWGPYGTPPKSIATGAPEMLLNPSFTSDTIWAPRTTGETLYTITGGALNITRRADPGNANGFLEGMCQDVEVINGRTYDLEMVITGASGGNARIKIAEYDIPDLNAKGIGTWTAVWTNTQFAGTSTRKFICSTTAQAANITYASVSMRLRPL
jgi:hypothetical protein